MSFLPTLQGGVVVAYLIAAGLLLKAPERRGVSKAAMALVLLGFFLHLFILNFRWLEIGQLPIVTRYEDMTVDALLVIGVYLFVQWRMPWLRRAGALILVMAALGLGGALAYSMDRVPWVPALRTNWLYIHSQLNSLAIGVGTAAMAAGLYAKSREEYLQAGRLLAWAFFFWAAMVGAGSYWASLAWGRYWGWDPIESWSLGTLLSYAFVLHLCLKWRWQGRAGGLVGLLPYGMMLFTTYGLLLVRGSLHGSYLFQ